MLKKWPTGIGKLINENKLSKHLLFRNNFIGKLLIGRPDKGTSVISLTAATAAMFPNADDHLSNCVRNPSQYN